MTINPIKAVAVNKEYVFIMLKTEPDSSVVVKIIYSDLEEKF